jgi:hypothetical protein
MSTREKFKHLQDQVETPDTASQSRLKIVNNPANQRIALITNDSDHSVSIDYAIETCSRLEGKIDLLIPNPTAQTDSAALENRFRSVGIPCNTIPLGSEPVDEIKQYLDSHSPVTSIFAVTDDQSIKRIFEEIISQPCGSISIPMVLIGKQSSLTEQSAA